MRILIDGYNLLFQSPFIGKGRGRGWLERARRNLIVYLHSRIAEELLQKTFVVFDASQVGDSNVDYRSDKGVTVLFSRLHAEADDLLEEFIRKHPSPKSLLVVSSDQRVRKCAKARRAVSINSEHFLTGLDQGRWKHQGTRLNELASESQTLDEKNQSLTDDQINFWLDEFNL